MMKYLTFCAFTLIFLFVQEAQGQEKELKNKEVLKEYISAARDSFDLPGMAVGIVKDGEVYLSEGFGTRSLSGGREVTPNTSFAIASLSKAFTAAGVGLLVERGDIAWDDKVVDILPEFRLHDPCITKEVTVEDLICHRVGLRTFDGDLLWYGTDHSRDEVIRGIRHLPLTQEFRSEYGYQNIMFIAAGEVIEKVTGKNWGDFIEEHFLNPLKMDLSNVSIREFNAEQEKAMPHLEGEELEYWNYDNAGPAAGLNSNVDDLNNWLMMWMNNGVFKEDTILPPSLVADLLSPRTLLTPNSIEKAMGSHFKAYGAGWFLTDLHGSKVAFHGGGLPGFISKIAVVPEEEFGVIVLSNDMSAGPTALVYEMIDRFLGGVSNDRVAQMRKYERIGEKRDRKRKAKRDKARVQGTEPSLNLQAYTGKYRDEMYGNAKITLEDGELSVNLLPSKRFVSTMDHWHHDTFRIKWEKDPFLPRGFVTFDLNTDGEVTGFTIEMPNPDFHFGNLEFKKL